MEQTDWASRWTDGKIGFHQPDVSHFLATYADEVWGTAPLERVYVPLCGKTLDLAFLADRAKSVVGVEYVEQAVVEFFAERELTPEIETEPLVKYSAESYTLYAADFFAITAEVAGPIDAVFDRASLVALDAKARIRYANHMASILSTGAKTLLVTFDYDQSMMNGPPFAVSAEEVHNLFDANFEVGHLNSRDALSSDFTARGLSEMTESAFSLTRK